jgi:hypothetical protein
MDVYDVGDRRKLSVVITDEDGDEADPDDVTFLMSEPDGTVTAYEYGLDSELVKTGTGAYQVEWDCLMPGNHVWRIEASGIVAAAEEAFFHVRQSQIAYEPS